MSLHLLRIRTGSESGVSKRIRAIGVRTYLPRYLEFLPTGPVEHALYPGYIFVWVEDQWRKLRQIRHVWDFVRNGGVPTVVPEQIVTDLRARENPYGYVRLASPFSVGQRVRLDDSEAYGLIVGLEPRQRVRLLFRILGREKELVLPERDLVAA